MPPSQILYLMMFVGNLVCTSHVLQYSSSRSYEHSRSLQEIWKTAAKLYIFSQTAKLFRIFFAFSVNFTQERLDISHNLSIFAPESIKSSHLRMDSPTEHKHKCHGGQYDAEAIVFTSKQNVMQQHIYYIRYALRFADMQISELVSVSNDQVQNRGWSSMRAYHDQALIDEFQRRGIDTAAVAGRKTISFAHLVRYDQFTNRLVPMR